MTADATVWNAWTTVTPVAAASASRPRFVRVRLPLSVDPGPDGAYADLRVVDDRGAETPYAFDPERAHHATAWRADPARDVETKANAAYADERPATERTPGVLTAVLLAIAAGLGAPAVFTVRASKTA